MVKLLYLSFRSFRRGLFTSTPRLLQTQTPTSTQANQVPNSPVAVEEKFFLHRKKIIEDARKNGDVLYPHFNTVPESESKRIELVEFIVNYSELKPAQKAEKAIFVSGRVTAKREASSNLTFYDLCQGEKKIQIVSSKANFGSVEDFTKTKELIQIGDIIDIKGIPGRTKTGELSVYSSQINLLAPTLHAIPYKSGLSDPAIRARQRHLDLLVNEESRERFKIRTKVIKFIRNYLDEKGFLEVETPILSTSVGGANARPFTTHSNANNLEMSLRISPELYLKKLVVGGFEKVYELGKQFRNEGIDSTHNPEFTTCEFYQSYANFETLIQMTEEMISKMVLSLHGSLKVEIPLNVDKNQESKETVTIDFTPPFQVLHFIPEIESHLNKKLPSFDDPQLLEKLIEEFREHSLLCPKPYTPSRLLDHACGKLIESKCIQPTFLIGHPTFLSPLAKEHPQIDGATSRFELFIGGKEIVNAYTELNDPFEQRKRFGQQMKDRMMGDNEAQVIDEEFCQALEYGLPPTAGWGMGIDRFVMLMTNVTQIKDVLLFPLLK